MLANSTQSIQGTQRATQRSSQIDGLLLDQTKTPESIPYFKTQKTNLTQRLIQGKPTILIE